MPTSKQFIGAPALAGSTFDPVDSPKKKDKQDTKQTLTKKHRNNEGAMNFTIEKFRRFKKFLKKYGGKKFADGPTKKFGYTAEGWHPGFSYDLTLFDDDEAAALNGEGEDGGSPLGKRISGGWYFMDQTAAGDFSGDAYTFVEYHGSDLHGPYNSEAEALDAVFRHGRSFYGYTGDAFADRPTKKFADIDGAKYTVWQKISDGTWWFKIEGEPRSSGPYRDEHSAMEILKDYIDTAKKPPPPKGIRYEDLLDYADRPTKKFEDIDGFDVDTDDTYGALWAKAYRAGEAAGVVSSSPLYQRAAWLPWARSEGIDPNHLSIKDAFHRGFDKSTGIDTEDIRGRHPSSGYAFADRPTKKFANPNDFPHPLDRYATSQSEVQETLAYPRGGSGRKLSWYVADARASAKALAYNADAWEWSSWLQRTFGTIKDLPLDWLRSMKDGWEKGKNDGVQDEQEASWAPEYDHPDTSHRNHADGPTKKFNAFDVVYHEAYEAGVAAGANYMANPTVHLGGIEAWFEYAASKGIDPKFIQLKTAFRDGFDKSTGGDTKEARTRHPSSGHYYADRPTKHFTDGVKARSKFANILEAEEQYVAHMRKEATPITEDQAEDFRDGYRSPKKFAVDPTEDIRREMVGDINIVEGSREYLENLHGQVWDHIEMPKDFDVEGFMAPFVVVRRKSDGQKGSLMFQHHPRFYWGFDPTSLSERPTTKLRDDITAKFSLFPGGQIVTTAGVSSALPIDVVNRVLALHLGGNWGDTGPEDSKMNDEAVKSGRDRIFSVYSIVPVQSDYHGMKRSQDKVWVITEADRSVTTVLFPSEY